MSASALRHTDEGGKEHDDENIITGDSAMMSCGMLLEVPRFVSIS